MQENPKRFWWKWFPQPKQISKVRNDGASSLRQFLQHQQDSIKGGTHVLQATIKWQSAQETFCFKSRISASHIAQRESVSCLVDLMPHKLDLARHTCQSSNFDGNSLFSETSIFDSFLGGGDWSEAPIQARFSTQACLNEFLPPNFGLSLQNRQTPQSSRKQFSHCPHLLFLLGVVETGIWSRLATAEVVPIRAVGPSAKWMITLSCSFSISNNVTS